MKTAILVLLGLLVMSASTYADTIKTYKACNDDIDNIVGRWKKGERDGFTRCQALIVLSEKLSRAYCALAYIDGIDIDPLWPTDGKLWADFESSPYGPFAETLRLQIQKSIPDMPVFVDGPTSRSFETEWLENYMKKNESFPIPATFFCSSRINGEATGGGLKSALRAHYIECTLRETLSGLEHDFRHLGLIEDHNLEEDFKRHSQAVVDQLVATFNCVKRY